MSAMTMSHVEDTVEVAGGAIHLMKGGQGGPLLILHDDMGTLVGYLSMTSLPSNSRFMCLRFPATANRSVRRGCVVSVTWRLSRTGCSRLLA